MNSARAEETGRMSSWLQQACETSPALTKSDGSLENWGDLQGWEGPQEIPSQMRPR